MTRQTSIDAYNQIKSLGLLGALQFNVYRILFEKGPMTQGELWQDFYGHMQRHSIAPRFAELKTLGVISEVGERPCRITGVNAIIWDVTNQLPTAAPVKKASLRETLSQLVKDIHDIRTRLDKMESNKFEPSGQGVFALRNH